MSPPSTVTVGPSLRNVLVSLTIATVAITGGFAILVLLLEQLVAVQILAPPAWLWSWRWTIVACTGALFACYRGIAVVGVLLWARPRIEIDRTGFTDFGVFGSRSRRWSDTEGSFTVIRVGWPFTVGWQQVVAYRLTDAFKDSTRMSRIASLHGHDEAILICPELSTEALRLAEVLNEWKRGAPCWI